MLTPPVSGASASTVFAAKPTVSAAAAGLPDFPPGDRTSDNREHIRHMLFGTRSGLQTTIRHLHKLGYADPNDWSKPISTGRPNEVMAILTKRINAL